MKVYLIEEIDKDALELLKKNASITNSLEEADIILTRNLNVNKEMIDKAKSLKCIAVHGTGVSDIDIPYAKSKGIIVFNAPYQNVESVAELNVMLTLMALRKARQNSLDIKDYYGLELCGKTVGILGYGHIGRRTYELIKAFGANVIAYNRTPLGGLYELDYVLANSDIIILAMAADNTNYHMINDKLISKMKDNVILVNTARGALVDEVSILNALRNKKISLYASDVFEVEPIDSNNPLLNENTIIYPHIGSNTKDALRNVGKVIVDEIIDFINVKEVKYKL